MGRTSRAVVGLLLVVPVIALAGYLLTGAGVTGVPLAWIVFGVAAGWVGATVWWVLRAPGPPSAVESGRYLDLLFRHARIRPGDDPDDVTDHRR